MNKDTQCICDYRLSPKKFVSIDLPQLCQVARKNFRNIFPTPDWRIPNVFAEHDWVFAANSIVINALNFAFNIFEKPDVKYCFREGGFTGALAMAERMYFGEKIIQGHDLTNRLLSRALVKKHFLDGKEQIPLRSARDSCAFDVIEILEHDYGSNPMNLLEEAMVWDEKRKQSVWYAFNNGKGVVEILVEKFPVAYGDTWHITDSAGTHELKFNKKAQLVALMLYGRGQSSRVLPPLVDIDEVGPLADYEVPNALRALGIIKYTPALAEKVDHWQEIEAGSMEELEIRLATIHACACLREEINRFRIPESLSSVNIAQLDYWLWTQGRNAKLRPHLCRTSAY